MIRENTRGHVSIQHSSKFLHQIQIVGLSLRQVSLKIKSNVGLIKPYHHDSRLPDLNPGGSAKIMLMKSSSPGKCGYDKYKNHLKPKSYVAFVHKVV